MSARRAVLCACGELRRAAMRCRERAADASGQSTVEYALVAAAFAALIAGLGVLWRHFSDGSAAAAAVASLTHSVPSGVLDVLAFR